MSLTEFVIAGPADGPYGVTVADGAVWTTLVHTGRVAKLRPDGGTELIDLDAPKSRPSVVVAGPDDAVWFTRNGDDHLGRIGFDGSVSAVPIAGAPYGLCVGPDGALWCTLMSTDEIGRVTVDGQVTTYPIGTTGAFPAMITASGDDLWFTLNQGNAVGRMTTTGHVTTYPLRTGSAGPVGISAGSDAIWFVEILAGQAGRITPDGKLEEFPLPDDSKPHAVATTRDGGCWVTLWGASTLLRLDAQGNILRQVPLTEGSEPHGLTMDGDSVWTALETGSIARLDP